MQYASKPYRSKLEEYGITQSMSHKGNCWDNAPVESFFKILKVEAVYGENPFETREEAKRVISEHIKVTYNRKRGHSSLGYLSPVEYEMKVA